jgi:hypothetical protein
MKITIRSIAAALWIRRPLARTAFRVLAACGTGVLALLASACGSGPGGATGTSAAPTRTVTVTPPAPVRTASPAPAGPRPCPPGALRLTVGTSNGAAGTIFYPLDFTNISGSACTMYGYPGVAFMTAPGGTRVGPPAGRGSNTAPALVTLAPRATAHATLAVGNALIGSDCRQPAPVNGIQAYPPGQYSALYAPLSRPGCADPSLVTAYVTVVTSGP